LNFESFLFLLTRKRVEILKSSNCTSDFHFGGYDLLVIVRHKLQRIQTMICVHLLDMTVTNLVADVLVDFTVTSHIECGESIIPSLLSLPQLLQLPQLELPEIEKHFQRRDSTNSPSHSDRVVFRMLRDFQQLELDVSKFEVTNCS
jgi:hypothetical protein